MVKGAGGSEWAGHPPCVRTVLVLVRALVVLALAVVLVLPCGTSKFGLSSSLNAETRRDFDTQSLESLSVEVLVVLDSSVWARCA